MKNCRFDFADQFDRLSNHEKEAVVSMLRGAAAAPELVCGLRGQNGDEILDEHLPGAAFFLSSLSASLEILPVRIAFTAKKWRVFGMDNVPFDFAFDNCGPFVGFLNRSRFSVQNKDVLLPDFRQQLSY